MYAIYLEMHTVTIIKSMSEEFILGTKSIFFLFEANVSYYLESQWC